jgi:hydrogenase maturation protein HypF
MTSRPKARPAPAARRRIEIGGVVQGVGFRPFVYNLACRYGLTGFVSNTSRGVEIEVEGEAARLAAFFSGLSGQAPPQAEIVSLTSVSIPPAGDTSFRIEHSRSAGRAATLIAPDLALCADCLTELFDPADRRYRYPFINCTNCGPRYSIVSGIPYDRPATAMRHFTMCAECRHEYDDPGDRRFHAQPNACPACGPRLWLADQVGKELAAGHSAIEAAAIRLRGGEIIAVKGLAGFHLAVNAEDQAAVLRLRQRKGREEKPLAVMVADLAAARQLVQLTKEEEALLSAPPAPILVGLARSGHSLAPAVAPGTGRLGVMLAYTPLHHLLLRTFGGALVMTSGNLSEEPICLDNAEALRRLAAIADGFLLHDREIYVRGDDSVLMRMAGAPRFLRRGRGYVPRPLPVDGSGPVVLAVGGELKNALCLLKDEQAFVGQHLGDLKNLAAYDFFRENIAHLLRIFECEPELVVHDLHPGYLSTRWALEEQARPTLAVQHHHAHLVSVLAEQRQSGPAIGIILDGTGYGADHTIWGGEILVGDARGFRRAGAFETLPLPGGDAAVKEVWRTGLGYLHAAHGGVIPELPFLQGRPVEAIREILDRRLNCPQTSSCGRLFDAVAAMVGLRSDIAFEAQAAIELMEAAGGRPGQPYRWAIAEDDAIFRLLLTPMLREIAGEVRAGATPARVSRRLHATLVAMLTGAALRVHRATGLDLVVLSGGVFNNYLLLEGLHEALRKEGFRVLTHEKVPAGDGGIALGQALIGRQHLVGLSRND